MATDTPAKQPPAPTDVVIAQLAEIDRSIAELDKVIQEAQAKKDGFVMMRRALAPLIQQQLEIPPLAPLEPKGTTPLFPGLAGREPILKPAQNTQQGSNTNTGFREAVRGALREAAPKGLKPAELIKVLTDRGDLGRYTGKGRPQDRVYSELHSLKSSREITKRYGRYVIVVSATEGNHA